jgi:enamine deaminase RidA (YjgF/YER057c/UK114 family)
MMTAEQRLLELQVELPEPPQPVGAYVTGIRSGNLIFTSGQLPFRQGKLLNEGKVPDPVTIKLAQACARQAAINALSVVRSLTGSLDAVVRIVRVNAFVNSCAGFTDQAQVVNGASELLVDIFGPSGRHSRCAIGAAELPLNAPVEIDLIVEVRA